MGQEPDPEPDVVQPMTPEARRHRRIIFVVMLLFCAVPIVFLVLRISTSETP